MDLSLSIHPEEIHKVSGFADEIENIEVYFTNRFPESLEVVDELVDFAAENDVEILTAHGTRNSDLGTPYGTGSLKAQINGIVTEYSGLGHREFRKDMNQLEVINIHAPYKDDQDLTRKETLENTVRNISEVNQALDENNIDTVATLENSASNSNLLSNVEDIEDLMECAEDLGVKDNIHFTYDVGHHPDIAMIDAMEGKIRNIHIHDFVDEENITNEGIDYWMDSDYSFDDPVGMRERKGVLTHLPVGTGDLNYETLFSKLDSIEYEGPLTVEMDRSVKDERSWMISKDAINSYRES